MMERPSLRPNEAALSCPWPCRLCYTHYGRLMHAWRAVTLSLSLSLSLSRIAGIVNGLHPLMSACLAITIAFGGAARDILCRR